ncbi:hypothetical protein [Streptomyces sp. NPDC059452]|uniref:hypothetical protein n=1 Tax=Streptomyces sp. NPDC059452 TaxID=3346835 RepID=UPI00368FE696
MRVKKLIRNADPVPAPAAGGLSARAAEELALLVGPEAGPPPAAARRPRARAFLTAALACVAAAVIGGVAFLLAAVDGADPGGVMADEAYYATTAELEGAADVIVRARLGAGREETGDGSTGTVATAEVVATAKGEFTGDALTVAYAPNGSGPETAGLTAGREYVFLLDRGDDGHYYLVNTTQGWYGVENGRKAVAGDDNDVALSPRVARELRITQ